MPEPLSNDVEQFFRGFWKWCLDLKSAYSWRGRLDRDPASSTVTTVESVQSLKEYLHVRIVVFQVENICIIEQFQISDSTVSVPIEIRFLEFEDWWWHQNYSFQFIWFQMQALWSTVADLLYIDIYMQNWNAEDMLHAGKRKFVISRELWVQEIYWCIPSVFWTCEPSSICIYEGFEKKDIRIVECKQKCEI